MSSSVFESDRFQFIQNYDPETTSLAVEDNEPLTSKRERNIQTVIDKVLSATEDGITDETAEAYEQFLGNVEIINGEFSELNYGNPFSVSIDQMRERLVSYKQEKKDQAFKNMVTGINGFNYERDYSAKTVLKMEGQLESFVNELIDDRLPTFSDSSKNKSISLAREIEKIAQHVKSNKIQLLADHLELTVTQTSPIYRGLLAGRPIVFENAEAVQPAANQINTIIGRFAYFLKADGIHLDKVEAQTLLNRLYAIDDLMIEAGVVDERSPIASSIESLETYLEAPPRVRPLPKKEEVIVEREKEALVNIPKPRLPVSELLKKFEKNKDPVPSPTISRSSPKRKELTPEERRDRFASSVATRLENLHRMDSLETLHLISDLERNRDLFSSSDQRGIDSLIQALSLLRSSNAFKPSAEENALMNRWMMFLGAYGITDESYHRTIDPVQRELKGELIQLIQANGDSFGNLRVALDEQLPTLQGKAIFQRLIGAEVTAKQTKPFSRAIAINLTNTIQQMQAYKVEARTYCEQKWDGVLRKFDASTAGKFSPVIAHLGYCNLGRQIDSIEASLIDNYLKTFAPVLFEKATTESSEAFTTTLEGVKALERDLYAKQLLRRYNGVKPDLNWIRDHIDFIKVVYDQGSDSNRNMDSGTCLQNSQDRHKILLRTPFLPSEEIELGSSQVGRYNRGILNQLAELYKRSPKKAERALATVYERIGLNSTGSYPVSVAPKQDLHEALYLELSRLVMDEGQSLFILGMNGEADGHAINIQVDLSGPIYRFIDDNIGVVECPDAITFKETLSSWLRHAYSDLPRLELRTLAATSPSSHSSGLSKDKTLYATRTVDVTA